MEKRNRGNTRTVVDAVGWVYFLKAEGVPRIKIGFSQDMQKRLRDIQGCCPVKLTVLKVVKADYKTEQALLALFAEHCVHGEWFDAHKSLLAFIDRLKDQQAFSFSELFLAK